MEEERPQTIQMGRAKALESVKDRNPSRLLEFPRTETKWQLDPIFHEGGKMTGQVVLCGATQVAGPDVGLKAIVKTLFRVCKDAGPIKTVDDLKEISKVLSEDATRELRMLKGATEMGCTATANLLDYKVEIQTAEDIIEGAYALHILMEKIPGRDLEGFGELSMAERNEARIAFGTAIREFSSCGYIHYDPHPGNIMWDPEGKKAYIIDFEDICSKDVARSARIDDFYTWGLAGPYLSYVDPMVASFDIGRPMPDEAELRRVATETMGKGLVMVEVLDYYGL
ncbi:hypothetical protein FQN54_005456 [Arachnomyces sp. PD_36]|nr:hypothetical protein FQN54_005456 [Arachnomyces sp. PD_36]